MKTYIDGVEVADPTYVATIDPSTIERVEVLRGPQGSTIYGSNASGGVMQIFTKKGALKTPHPNVETKVSAGAIQSQWGNTAQTDNSLAITGGGSDFSYNLGGGFLHNGNWLPDAASTNVSLFAGLRGAQGPLTVELSGRYYDKSFGYPINPGFRIYTFYSKPYDQTWLDRQQTYGLSLKYVATPHWQHNVVVGYDRTAFDQYSNAPRFTTPDDSFLSVSNSDYTKASLAYNTTYEFLVAPAVKALLTAGADHWTYHRTGFYACCATSTANTIPSPSSATRSQYSNTGYFAQGQVGFGDAFFVTAGLRAERNQNFGQDYGVAWAPRVGLAYARAFGAVTAKARMAYGKAIRTPDPGATQDLVYDAFDRQLGNPNLGPEQQRGWDSGLELYFGQRGSVEVTYYHQTAIDLIDLVNLAFSPVNMFQYQNVGRIKNTGWEFQGRTNVGRLSLTGSYSITSSVVEQLSPTYSGALLPGDQLLHIPKHTAGATIAYSLPRTTLSVGMTYVDSWTETDFVALYGFYFAGQPYRGSNRDYWITYPAFVKFNLSASQALTGHLSVFVHSDNVTNKNVYERQNTISNTGRMTMIGLRTSF